MIIQTNTYICEGEECNRVESMSKETSPHSDPVVSSFPNGREWDYGKDDKFLCPECLLKDKP